MLDILEFKTILESMLKLEVSENSETLEVEFNGEIFKLTKDYFDDLIKILDSKNTDEETLLYDKHYLEVLTRGENLFIPRIPHNEVIKKEDLTNGITYEYKSCSDEYLIFIINKIHEAGLSREYYRRFRRPPRILRERIGGDHLLDLIRIMFPRIDTVRVSSTKVKSKVELERLCNSFLFQMSYNLNYTIVELRFLEEFFRSNRLLRLKRANLEEMEPPKRKYISDLIYHYQMALSAESPMLQFLSFYHIIEYFFERIYNEEMVNIVEREITSPHFSPKRDNDIKKLIKLISKKIKERGDSYSFNEQEALMLTLYRYIKLDDLKDKLDEYDEKLIDYYKSTEVQFSKGNMVDLNQDDLKVFNKLAYRIYKTRNAIVHSKDGEKAKFTPFTDDKYLINEIPLLRFIAEDVIMGTSELI